MKELIKKLKDTGFFHIFSSSVLNKIIGFCGGIFIVRLLAKSEYGIYSYSNNIVSMFLLLTGLGTASAMLQFGSENYKNPEKKKSFLNYGFRIGSIFNLLTIVVIVLYALFIPLDIKGAQPSLLLLAFIPAVTYLNDVIATCYRIDLKNKAYSYFNTGTTALVFAATIGGAVIGGIMGVIALRYVAYALVFLFAIFASRDLFAFVHHPVDLLHNEKLLFLKIAIISAINNGIGQLLYVIDVFFVGKFIKSVSVLASYKTGTLIPSALLFIPMSIMFYIYPYFAMHCNDISWVKKQYNRLFKIMLILSLIISVGLYILAPLIVHILFSSQYSDCVPVFRILVVGFFFTSAFKLPSGNILVTLKKVKINLYLAIVSGVLNIVLDVIFIKTWGSVGAAIATLCVNVFAGACSTIYLRWFLNKNTTLPPSTEQKVMET